ncbi:hypothetical protein [Jiulongibacter sediminis]|jgi:hypothetical protein|uniref:hypothetical protein n=1 Tax=Jiulongibacter sediminis TaxID=1605367 RepID=UPI0026F2CF70|nr:hypothetical protein [Jiulongibacter sediminis]
MPRTILLFLVLLGSLSSFGQRNGFETSSSSDSLYTVRKLFHTNVYRNNVKLSKSTFSSTLRNSKKWSRKNSIANIILPAGPLVTVGGVYLAYDAIKGVPMVYRHEDQDYPYVVRSLPKLLGGLALAVTGLSMVESANETKANATDWHNSTLQKKNEKAVLFRYGITPTGGIGLTANF